jgi:hypothetical protein
MKKFLFLLAVVISTGFMACEDTNGAGNSEAVTCVITFDANGGTGGQTTPLTAAYGEPMPELAGAPAREGYSFTGYFDAETGGTQYYNADLSSAKDWDKTEDTILYALWTQIMTEINTVSFDANGGGGGQTAPLTANYGEPMPELAGQVPVRMDRFDNPAVTKESTKIGYYFVEYYFDGYFDAQSGGTKYYNADLSPAKEAWDKMADTTLYARWTSIADRYGISPLLEADYTAHFAETAPVIDGNGGDPVWEKAQWKPIDQLWLSIPATRSYPSPENFTGRYKILWTAERLYFLAEIIDDVLSTTRAATPYTNPENDDCLEIFISENASTGNHLGNNDAFAYHISYGGTNVADYVGTGYNGGISQVKDGCLLRNDHFNYVVGHEPGTTLHTWELEVKIFANTYDESSAANIPVTLTEGKKMRFAIAYCDADSTNSRENFMGNVYISGTDKNQAYRTASVFTNLYLVK